jgi:hypothetical protein
MTLSRTTLTFCLLTLLLAACENNQAAPTATPAPAPVVTPAPAPAPAPTPAPETFTVTGRVTESAPTTDRRLSGAMVSIGSQSVLTDSSGSFTLTSIAAGSHTLTASKGDYVTATQTLNLPADAPGPLSIGLDPVYESITREMSGTVSADDPPCPGTHGNFTCFSYQFPAHHAQGIEGHLYWHSSDARLELELRCNEQTWVRTEGLAPQLVTFNREPYYHFRILEAAKKNQLCELRVLHISGDPMRFILRASHPN